jgi:hypothetical protein
MNDILSTLQAVAMLVAGISLSWFLCCAARALNRCQQPVTITFHAGDGTSGTGNSVVALEPLVMDSLLDERLDDNSGKLNARSESACPICGTCGKQIYADPISTMITDGGAVHIYRCLCGCDTGLPA